MMSCRIARFARRRAARRQCGTTLIEAVAYLGIAAILTAGVLALFTPGFTNAQATRLVGEATSVANNVRDLYASQSGYANMTMQNLVTANVFPHTLNVSGTGSSAAVSNTWGGAVTVFVTNNNAELQYASVPTDVCIRALISGGNWIDIWVNGTDLQTAAPSMQQVNSACNKTSGNTIGWVFQ